MATVDADAVIAWSSNLSSGRDTPCHNCKILSLFTDVTFCLLEQWCPDREDNPFMSTMLKHFAKLGTPLRSALIYAGEHTQTQRFHEAGYAYVDVQSLWDMWGDPRFLSPSQRMQLDAVEPFDEWEEFALFASHYTYVIAQTSEELLVPDLPRNFVRRDSEVSNLSDMSTRTVSPWREENEWFAYKYSPNPDPDARTHHGSSYLVPDEDAIAVHGGCGTKGRSSLTSVYAAKDDADIHPAIPPRDIGARCCHTVTTLQNRQNLLVGGRGSPSAPFRDAWLQTGNIWERVHDLPEPRYRHRAVSVILPDNTHGVIVFGGKTSPTRVASDCILWGRRDGWQRLRSLNQDPVPRFGASFVRLGFNHGVMFGGMRQDGIICQGLWRWRLIVRNNVVSGIKFRTSTALDTSVGIYPWLGRLGASYSVIKSELVIIGGIAKAGCIPKEYEILSIIGSFSAFADHEKEMELRVVCVSPRMDPGTPRPFLVGHSSHRTAHETTLIVGGGCTCFSFGSCWNNGAWLMHDRVMGLFKPWVYVKPKAPSPPESRHPNTVLPASRELRSQAPIQISTATIICDVDFQNIVSASAPKLLDCLDIGPCTKLWTLSYLKSRTSQSRKVIIHSAPFPTMNFQRKDSFNYTTLPFHTFLDILASSTKSSDINPHMYLRSISSSSPNSKPAILDTDWPEIASDFVLPPALSSISENLHSSPLRISTNLSMWLHYDVMANILFHVSSHPDPTPKQLILFPPSDMKYLSFPAGSTTSTLDIFPSPATTRPRPGGTPPATPVATPAATPPTACTTPILPSSVDLPPGTHPHFISVPPGSALYIPPLWSHTAAPSPPGIINISVNVFFRSLQNSLYAAGRDVYGNRDLSAYEEGRRDLEKIVKRFSGAKGKGRAAGEVEGEVEVEMPKDIAKAYMERLGQEILERAAAL